MLIKKIPGISDLLTAIVLKTKTGEVENKISDVSGLVKKADHKAKLSNTEAKCFTFSDYNKITKEILDAKIK